MKSSIKITEQHLKQLNIKCNFKFTCQSIGYVNHKKKNMLTY